MYLKGWFFNEKNIKIINFIFQPQLQLIPAKNIRQKQQCIKDKLDTKIEHLGQHPRQQRGDSDNALGVFRA